MSSSTQLRRNAAATSTTQSGSSHGGVRTAGAAPILFGGVGGMRRFVVSGLAMTVLLAVCSLVLLQNHAAMQQQQQQRGSSSSRRIVSVVEKLSLPSTPDNNNNRVGSGDLPTNTTLSANDEALLETLQLMDLVPYPNGEMELRIAHEVRTVEDAVSITRREQGGRSTLAVYRMCGTSPEAASLISSFVQAGFVASLMEDYHVLVDSLDVAKAAVPTRSAEGGDSRCHIQVSFSKKSSSAAPLLDARDEEGYSLCFGDDRTLNVEATSALGLLHAWRTVFQLSKGLLHAELSKAPPGGASSSISGRRGGRTLHEYLDPLTAILRGCLRNDLPKVTWRGLHLDTARHFHNTSIIKNILREMGMLKLNRFHWHLSDDQGWRLESKVLPGLHERGGRRGAPLNGKRVIKYKGMEYPEPRYHTQAEVEDVIQFALRRGIEVIPEVDLPAHAAAMVAGLRPHSLATQFGTVVAPSTGNEDCGGVQQQQQQQQGDEENSNAPNCMGGTFGVMHPTKAAVAIAKTILSEVCRVFHTSRWVHLGGDEAEFIRDGAWSKYATTNPSVRCDLEGCDQLYSGGGGGAVDYSAVQAILMDHLIDIVEDVVACPAVPPPPYGEISASSTNEKTQLQPRSAIVWDETIVELRKGRVPKDSARTTGMLWRDDRLTVAELETQYRNAMVPTFHAAQRPDGAKLILTPKTRLYFDYLQFAGDAKTNRFWPLQKPAPWVKYKAVTLERAFNVHAMRTEEEWREGSFVYGVEGCIWTELIHNVTVLEYQMLPRVYALADAAWTMRRMTPSTAVLKPQFKRFAQSVKRITEARTVLGDEEECVLCSHSSSSSTSKHV